MKLKLLLCLFILFYFKIIEAQNTLGTTLITDGVYNGLTLFTASTETYLINNCGEVVNQWSSTFPPGNAVYLREDGSILRAGRTTTSDIVFGGQGGVIEIFDWDGTMTWQYFYDTPQMRQHHDVYPMPNGNILILAATVLTNSEAIQAGRNPSLLPQSTLFNEQIIEITPTESNGATIVWEWNIKDHLIQDFNSSKDNFGDISLNPQKLNINFLNGRDGFSNWLHMNSIQFNPELNQIVLSSRNLSEIYIIDHSTTTATAALSSGGIYGKGGDFLYRWGNPQSYNQGTENSRKLYGQHYPHVIAPGLADEGEIILFNNGDTRSPTFSEVIILKPLASTPGFYDYTSNTSYGPTNPEYTYENDDFYSRILSSAQRLPNGNTLICEGINGRFFEINASGTTVWEYFNPVNNNTGNISNQGDDPFTIANATFRALKYPLNYQGFTGRDLTPSNPIENNSSTNVACSILSINDFNEQLVSIYPNPTQDFATIKTNNIVKKIEVISITGKKVLSIRDKKTINLRSLKTGIYFLRIYSESNIINKKIFKQ